MIARDHDRMLIESDPTAHAVLLTLQATARKLEPRRLSEVTIFTTHEPCAMCVGALVEAQVHALVFAVADDVAAPPAPSSSWRVTRRCRTSSPWSRACGRPRRGGSRPRRQRAPDGSAAVMPPGEIGHPLLDSAAERCPSGLRCRSRKAVCDEHRGFESHPLRHSHPDRSSVLPRPRRGRLEAYGAALEMRFGATRRGFESPPLRHSATIAAGRARRGTSGALYPQSATAGLNSRSRPTSLRLPRDRPTLRVGSHAAKVREPRQVRKEAAVSDRLRVPWGDLAGAGRSSRVRWLSFDAGCTAYSSAVPAGSRRHRVPCRRPLVLHVQHDRGLMRAEAASSGCRATRPTDRCTVGIPCRRPSPPIPSPLTSPPTRIGPCIAAGARRRFAEVLGQDPIVATLRRAVAADRTAHAYLFVGPRGTGKTSTARILAKAINCTNRADDGEPCDTCPACVVRPRGAGHGRHRDRRRQPRAGRGRPGPGDAGAHRAGRAAAAGLHHRRGPHAQRACVQRAAEDGGGAARPRRLHPGDHRHAQGAGHHHQPHPALRLPSHSRPMRSSAS